jgi:hypothetical protein
VSCDSRCLAGQLPTTKILFNISRKLGQKPLDLNLQDNAHHVFDLFSRRVVGWSMSAAMTAQMVADVLLMAVWRRGKPRELLHHPDQDSQDSSEHQERGQGRYVRLHRALLQCDQASFDDRVSQSR